MYDPSIKSPQSLILTPTREIAIQIESVLSSIGMYTPNFKVGSFIGGMDIAEDRKKMQGCKSIVGTPGRIQHLLKSMILNTSEIKLVVLDEADQMITNFATDVNNILSELKSRNQIIASSATFDPTRNLDKKLAGYMKNPIGVTPKKEAPILLGVKQFLVEIPQQDNSLKDMTRKIEEMTKIFTKIPFKQCLAFSNSQSRAESYCNYLNKGGWPSEVITGAQDQPTRIKVLNKLKEFKCRILLSTDLMARGIDADNVNLVINLDIPHDPSLYLHRIGRAGRFGSHGIAFTFVSSEKDLLGLRKLLGEIGGENMGVMRIPDDKNYDFWNFNDREIEKSICGEIFGTVDCKKIESMENIKLITESKNGLAMEKKNKEEEDIINENLALLEISKLLIDNEEEIQVNLDDLFEDFNQNKISVNGTKVPEESDNSETEDENLVVTDLENLNETVIENKIPVTEKRRREETDNSETVSVNYETSDSSINSDSNGTNIGSEEESNGFDESESELDLFGKNIDNVENEIESETETESEPEEIESEDEEDEEIPEDYRSPEGSMINETGSYHSRYYSWTSQFAQQTTLINDYVNFCKFVKNN